LAVRRLVQPLEVDRVLEAAGGMFQRELADLAVDPRAVDGHCARPGAEARDDRSDAGVVERDPLELRQEHASEERDDELGPAHPATREELTARTYPGEPGVDSGSDQRAVMALGCGPRTAVPSWPIGPSRRPWRRSAAAGRLASRGAFAATEGREEASYCGRGDRMTTAVSRERRAA
jgi:hypothetical protein